MKTKIIFSFILFNIFIFSSDRIPLDRKRMVEFNAFQSATSKLRMALALRVSSLQSLDEQFRDACQEAAQALKFCQVQERNGQPFLVNKELVSSLPVSGDTIPSSAFPSEISPSPEVFQDLQTLVDAGSIRLDARNDKATQHILNLYRLTKLLRPDRLNGISYEDPHNYMQRYSSEMQKLIPTMGANLFVREFSIDKQIICCARLIEVDERNLLAVCLVNNGDEKEWGLYNIYKTNGNSYQFMHCAPGFFRLRRLDYGAPTYLAEDPEGKVRSMQVSYDQGKLQKASDYASASINFFYHGILKRSFKKVKNGKSLKATVGNNIYRDEHVYTTKIDLISENPEIRIFQLNDDEFLLWQKEKSIDREQQGRVGISILNSSGGFRFFATEPGVVHYDWKIESRYTTLANAKKFLRISKNNVLFIGGILRLSIYHFNASYPLIDEVTLDKSIGKLHDVDLYDENSLLIKAENGMFVLEFSLTDSSRMKINKTTKVLDAKLGATIFDSDVQQGIRDYFYAIGEDGKSLVRISKHADHVAASSSSTN
ncbi:hypothetical protein A3F66_02705 [candidate division TM6 bacterium RIFCSPHIGHO2_12_FULL_32_22]|nr:MAG: hypothetical protein A3F66_02705 [candidate division TM6 bacterium RIFCSPHIGHO2_12_FULL_32_22]